MYSDKKISVAIATYNGEQFLGQQMDSILQQTVLPDELVISDDGSTDRTLEIAEQYAKQFAHRLSFRILTDNPRHGIGGNFTWAIAHTAGDYVFICGQDDLWAPEKVEHVAAAFAAHPEAELIGHYLDTIDKDNHPISRSYAHFHFDPSMAAAGDTVNLSREEFLNAAISTPLMPGNAICISADLKEKALPIPVSTAEDHWLEFCAAAGDKIIFLNEVLASYRIHDSSTKSVNMRLIPRLKKTSSAIRNAFKYVRETGMFAQAAEQYIKKNEQHSGYDFSSTYDVANGMREISVKQLEIASSGRLTGAWKLLRLYTSNERYRKMGKKATLCQLANVLLFSRRRRRIMLGLHGEVAELS